MSLQDTFSQIRDALLDGPKSINELAEVTDINWRTAKKYLEILAQYGSVEERKVKNTRTFYIKDPDNYFDLPIPQDDATFLASLYAYITEYCNEQLDMEPSETHIYKVTWKVAHDLQLDLPVGWYRYGPMSAKPYDGDELFDRLPESVKTKAEEVAADYCTLSPIELKDKVYEEENNALYLAKERLLPEPGELEDDLMTFIQEVPEECTDVATDFARLALREGWTDEVRECFELVWNYVATVCFGESLQEYYEDVSVYLEDKIEDRKREAQTTIKSLA